MNLAGLIGGHDPASTAIVDRDVNVTYADLRRHVAAMQADLAERGIAENSVVALATGNDLAFVVSMLSVLSLGGIVMPLNPGAPTSELVRKLDVVDPDLLLIGHAGRAHLDAESISTPSADLIEMTSAALAADDISSFVSVARSDDAPAFYLATSGVSGNAKVAVLTHHNMAWIHEALAEIDPPVTSSDVTLGVLPFTHIFGVNVVLLGTLRSGGKLVLQQRFDPDESLRLVQEHGVTMLTGAPPMWQRWMACDAPDDALASVQYAASGAAALPIAVFEAAKERFGIEIAQGYGLTETSPIVTLGRGCPIRPTSVGRVMPGVEVALVDEAGTPVDLGDEGEIVVRSPGVFAGYFGDVETTESMLSEDGWLWTGDVGIFDEDGYLYLVDRIKDIVIVSGFNVYPAEVENVLMAHPGVQGAIVTGAVDAMTGEAVVAHVTGTATQEELEEHVAEHLSRYKQPSVYHFLDELPIAPNGKAIRRALR